jgi:hypothetical protein
MKSKLSPILPSAVDQTKTEACEGERGLFTEGRSSTRSSEETKPVRAGLQFPAKARM